MAILDRSFLLLTGLAILANLFSGTRLILANYIPISFNRSSFPDNFVFGAASSAYQYEGEAKEGGRGQSIWDTFVHQHPEKIADQSTGDVAIDFYHRYKEDISMVKDIGMDAFRLSISWPRILPRGKINGGINHKGIKFYNNVIDELISKGTLAPGRCSNYAGNCTKGNSATEPYIVVHNQLLCHAAAVKVYREMYEISQKGEIGISLSSQWYEPKTRSAADLKASYRVLDFQLGWFMHPITYGDYPPIMRSYVGSRLPKFTKEQSKLLKGSKDFFGFNYYTTRYASPCHSANTTNLSYTSDSCVDISTYKNGIPICEPTPLYWLFNCPKGIRDLMLYVKKKYNDPAMYITENGMADQDNTSMSIQEALMDDQRIRYYQGHLWSLQEAIKDGANVKGHFVWSFFDDFEWASGYTSRFGINYVDYKDGLKRYIKHSAACWYQRR